MMRHDSHRGFLIAPKSVPPLRDNPIMLARSLPLGARETSSPRASTLPEGWGGLKLHIHELTTESGSFLGGLGRKRDSNRTYVKIGGSGRADRRCACGFELAMYDQARDSLQPAELG